MQTSGGESDCFVPIPTYFRWSGVRQAPLRPLSDPPVGRLPSDIEVVLWRIVCLSEIQGYTREDELVGSLMDEGGRHEAT